MQPIANNAPSSASDTTLAAGSTVLVGLAASLLALMIFVGLAFYIGRGPVAVIDTQALAAAYQLRIQSPWLDPLMNGATDLGSATGLVLQGLFGLVILAWQKLQRWRQDVVLLVMATTGAAILNLGLKSLFARARPDLYPGPIELGSYSFPSGHSMASAAFYGTLAWIAARHTQRRSLRLLIALVAAIITMLIGMSRMYFSVHYPSDVLGGFVAGVSWLLTVDAVSSLWRWRLRRRLPGDRPAAPDQSA